MVVEVEVVELLVVKEVKIEMRGKGAKIQMRKGGRGNKNEEEKNRNEEEGNKNEGETSENKNENEEDVRAAKIEILSSAWLL